MPTQASTENSLNRGVAFFVKEITEVINDAQVELEESLDEKHVHFLTLEERLGEAEFWDYIKPNATAMFHVKQRLVTRKAPLAKS